VNNHYCEMKVVYDNGTSDTLTARVMINTTYEIVGDETITHYGKCTVHGYNHKGADILLELIE